MIDLWLDREAAEMDSQQYFDEMALDDHLIELYEQALARAEQVNEEALALVAAGSEEIF